MNEIAYIEGISQCVVTCSVNIRQFLLDCLTDEEPEVSQHSYWQVSSLPLGQR